MQKINQCINPKLASLCQKAIFLDALNELIQQYLPAHLKAHCHVGSFSNNCLKLMAKPAWSTELRYLLPELRDKLRTEAGLFLSSIKIENFIEPTVIHKEKKSIGISDTSRQCILSEAEVMEPSPLKEALLKLGRNYESE